MRKNAVVSICIFFAVLCNGAFFIFAGGAVGPDFLRIEPPARAAGMSGAFCAAAEDSSAVLFNPAGLCILKNPSLSLTHFASFADTNYEWASFAVPGTIGWGGAFLMCYTGAFDEIDAFGQKAGKVENYDYEFTLSASAPVTDAVWFGISAKYFYSRLYKFDKNGFVADFGMMTKVGVAPDTYLSVVLQNLGFQEAYDKVVDTLPLNFKAGMAIKQKFEANFDFMFCVDVNRLTVKDELPTLDLGVETRFFDTVSLNAGYGLRHSDTNFSLGAGFKIEKKYTLSYAYQPFNMLGNTHRVSLDIEL